MSELPDLTCANEECQLARKIMLAQQESLEAQIEALKQKVANLTEENKELRRNSVTIQQQAEQEEEYISNTLLKKIQMLKQEKESLAINYEQEEEFLTNDLSRKLQRLKAEKVEMEKNFEAESEAICNKLTAKINNLERQLKEETFFIENPEQMESNFLNKDIKKEFQKQFKQKSKDMVEVLSKKHRHAKKIRKKRENNQAKS